MPKKSNELGKAGSASVLLTARADRKIRTSALASLHTFLSSRQISSSLTTLDILKLWKGLYFALWMCDRAIPQQTLCAELADLINVLPRHTVVPWLRGFWATMSREWTSIDVLRMEKFLLLVRRVVASGFKWMKKGEEGKKKKSGKETAWDMQRVDNILDLLNEWPFALEDEARVEQGTEKEELVPQTIPVGLRLHVLDIWVDEAEKVGLLEADDVEASKILQRIIDQVDALEQATTRPAVRIRSKDSLEDERLPGNRKPAEQENQGVENGGNGDWDGFDD
ncbi:nucleolar protein,Nop52-domain-containing protein [Apiosordaria backusii]|uniref:Nucleolar protein,Nop52-domain-containing protein n=1 Tax=Apiosordaria backusii TaxID=314023 RepID=A0AA40EM87_9PEZI|nr:nucleolar protein,Nop52-domain-containing protein [Apiosordaria backusii]